MTHVQFMGREWAWNPLDKKLLQVNDWIKDLYTALDYVPNDRRGIAIQAGGAMGVWPYELSQQFDVVFTFEPDQGNFDCLQENIADCGNVISRRAALGAYEGFATVKLPASEQGNAGAFYTMPAREGVSGQQVPQFSIDTLSDEGYFDGRVDFIQLDVEGREMDVLAGAIETITHDLPVIMLEDKPLPQDRETGHKFGEVEQFLTSEMGYRVAKKVHRDIIFVPSVAK